MKTHCKAIAYYGLPPVSIQIKYRRYPGLPFYAPTGQRVGLEIDAVPFPQPAETRFPKRMRDQMHPEPPGGHFSDG